MRTVGRRFSMDVRRAGREGACEVSNIGFIARNTQVQSPRQQPICPNGRALWRALPLHSPRFVGQLKLGARVWWRDAGAAVQERG